MAQIAARTSDKSSTKNLLRKCLDGFSGKGRSQAADVTKAIKELQESHV